MKGSVTGGLRLVLSACGGLLLFGLCTLLVPAGAVGDMVTPIALGRSADGSVSAEGIALVVREARPGGVLSVLVAALLVAGTLLLRPTLADLGSRNPVETPASPSLTVSEAVASPPGTS